VTVADGRFMTPGGETVSVTILGETLAHYAIEYLDRRTGAKVRQLVLKQHVKAGMGTPRASTA